MAGYFFVNRDLQFNWLWQIKPFSPGQAWIDLILIANFAPGKIYVRGIEVIIERGQVGWSEVKLADRWGWSRSKLRTFLNRLEKEQQIVQQKNNVTNCITIVNYDKYQLTGQQNIQQNVQQKDTNNKERIKNIYIKGNTKKIWQKNQNPDAPKLPDAEEILKKSNL
ncbi:MAG: hypothetical protein JXC36_02785 [Candidatus Atribacteria bacterium]|nr:hypothetical protein [Candidatus Atribacteria bacterium]